MHTVNNDCPLYSTLYTDCSCICHACNQESHSVSGNLASHPASYLCYMLHCSVLIIAIPVLFDSKPIKHPRTRKEKS